MKKQIAEIKQIRKNIVELQAILNEKRRKLYKRHGALLRALKTKLQVLENKFYGD